MYEQAQVQSRINDLPVQMKTADSFQAARKSGRTNPYEGVPLHVSGRLAKRIKQSFGINASELEMRESADVAKMGARATAQGNAIRFAPGEFRPDTREGMEVLGHELNHVREQAMGDVCAQGGELFEHPSYEARSDAAGAAFANGGLSAAAPVSVGGMSAEAAPVQGLFGGLKRVFGRLFGRRNRGSGPVVDWDSDVPEAAQERRAPISEDLAGMDERMMAALGMLGANGSRPAKGEFDFT